MKPTLSAVMPALNEEANIAAAVSEVIQVVEPRCADYEVLLVNDGSTDRTGAIMEEMARGNPRIRVIHHSTPRNTGAALSMGVSLALHEYIMMVPGDNENPREALIGPIEAIGRADVVIVYTSNPEVRPLARRLVSRVYVALLNLLFGLRLQYYNGTSIYKTQDLRRLRIHTNSFAHLAERLVKLLRSGSTYVEVGVPIGAPRNRRTKAFRFKNIVGVGKALMNLFYEIHLKREWQICR